MDLTLRVLGVVRSPLTDPAYRTAAKSLEAGQEILLFTWFHLADRDCQEVHPRRERSRPLTGVFSTRSPDRPNPIGLHQVRIAAIDGDVLAIEALEAVDGTPVIDIKPLPDRQGR